MVAARCAAPSWEPTFLLRPSDLVQMVQNAIDPPPGQGLGLGLAPIGAQVTVTAPKTVPVDISATLTLASGHELETVQQPAQDAVSDYLLQIRKNWDVNISSTAIAYSAEVYLARVLAALISLDGGRQCFGSDAQWDCCGHGAAADRCFAAGSGAGEGGTTWNLT